MYQPNQDTGIGFKKVGIIIGASILFFVLYSFLFPPAQPLPAENNQTQSTSSSTLAPASNTAPTQTSQDSTQIAPIQDTSIKSNNIISTITSKSFDIEIDTLGRIHQAYLKDERFLAPKQDSLADIVGVALGFSKKKEVEKIERLALLGDVALKPLEIRYINTELNNLAYKTPYTASIKEVKLDDTLQIELKQDLGELQVSKILHFYKNGSYDIDIKMSKNVEYFISNGMHPRAEKDEYTFRGVILKNMDDTIEKIEDGDATKTENTYNQVKFLSSVDRYYTSVFWKDSGGLDVIVDSTSADGGEGQPYIKANGDLKLRAYIGAKDYKVLESLNTNLTDVVEYGIITFFAKPLFVLLDFLYAFCANWGWAIVLLTIVVRIVLFPLTFKGMVSMQKLKDIAPKMKELQAKYKGEPQKLQASMMELYKKHGANPLGGCLPMLLQIPVFFAIYRVLYNSVELKSAEWILWIHDLSAIDPYFILPLVMGLSMYISQSITPSTFTDPMQAKIFKYLPVGFTIFFVIFPFPAGLVLYWSINNIFSIIQQLLINKLMERKKAKEIEEHKAK